MEGQKGDNEDQNVGSALQAAGSAAGLMITTECMICDIVEDKPAGGGDMSGMGGMGGMGGMM